MTSAVLAAALSGACGAKVVDAGDASMGSDPADAGRDASVCPAPATPPPEPLATPALLRLSLWPGQGIDGGSPEVYAHFPRDPSAATPALRMDGCELDPRVDGWPRARLAGVSVAVNGGLPWNLYSPDSMNWYDSVVGDVSPGDQVSLLVTQTPESGLGERRFQATMPSALRGVTVPDLSDGGVLRVGRDRPLLLRWDPVCGNMVRIVLFHPDFETVCEVPSEMGSYAVPSAVLQRLRTSPDFHLAVSVMQKQVSSWGPYPRVVLRVANGAYSVDGILE